ncbi:MAG: hypothetical protein RLZZ215_2854 [Pseudomonadota bacterium]|jgi:hypothetical protein
MHNKNKSIIFSLLITLGLSVATDSALADPVLEYKLALADDGKSYEVWMKPSLTPKPNISLTGQITLKVPHAANFKPTDVVAGVEGTDWIEASRVDAPKEDPKHDYISFSYIGAQGNSSQNYAWAADEELLVFSFANEKGCVNGLSIMQNNDPFNIPNNSQQTNPGNQFTNLGWGAVGENNFKGVYGDSPKCLKK